MGRFRGAFHAIRAAMSTVSTMIAKPASWRPSVRVKAKEPATIETADATAERTVLRNEVTGEGGESFGASDPKAGIGGAAATSGRVSGLAAGS